MYLSNCSIHNHSSGIMSSAAGQLSRLLLSVCMNQILILSLMWPCYELWIHLLPSNHYPTWLTQVGVCSSKAMHVLATCSLMSPRTHSLSPGLPLRGVGWSWYALSVESTVIMSQCVVASDITKLPHFPPLSLSLNANKHIVMVLQSLPQLADSP